MSDRRIRTKKLLEEVEGRGSVNAKLSKLSFDDRFIVKDLIKEEYLDGKFSGTNDQAVVRLTLKGRDYLDRLAVDQKPWWKKIYENVRSNLGTIVTTVLGVILAEWLVSMMFG